MYIWMIHYGYFILTISFLLLSPLFAFKINKKIFNKDKIYKVFLINIFIFSILIIGLLYLKSHHIYLIGNICFDYPVIAYKDNIPKECYSFDISKYQGIGWILQAMFWIVFEFFYFSIIYFIKSRISRNLF